MEKPKNSSEVFRWIGSHTSPKKTATAKANMAYAQAVRKAMQKSGKIVGGWTKGKKRKVTHDSD